MFLSHVPLSVSLTALLVVAASASYPPRRTYGHCYDRHKNRWYDQGRIETNDPCTTCECTADRDIACIANSCPDLACPNPIPPRAGECCPTCPDGCDFQGGWYDVGHITSGNPCELCDCHADGFVSCNAVSCPRLKCPAEYQTVPEGECCAVCQPGCDFRSNWYGVGHIQTDNVCESCTCLADGSAQCIEKECPRLYCPYDRQHVPEGECCAVCAPGCRHQDKWYDINDIVTSAQDYCNTCTCEDDGVIDCVRNLCPPTNCPARLRIDANEGECCPSCLTGCVVDDNVYGVGDSVPSSDECKTCECDDGGEVSCRATECPDPGYCPYGRHTPYGTCCPVCRRRSYRHNNH